MSHTIPAKIVFESAASPTVEAMHRQQTDDVVHLFSTTLHSLAANAAAVRQATSLAHCLDNEKEELFHEKLWELDDFVTALEEKVVALRQIVSEEKRSLAKFETTLQAEAQDQAAMLQQMLQALEQHEITTKNDDDIRSTSSDASGSSRQRQHARRGSRRDSVDPRAARSSNNNSENEDPVISLGRISFEEFESYKSSAPGPRITTSLMDLNEALEEIEQVCQRQRHVAMVLKRKQEQQLQHGASSSGALQRRFDYLQKRQQQQHGTSATLEGESDNDQELVVTITEQELRESCPFFRHGESTARVILSLLCSLKRLKQVPTKNRQVTYHLLL